MFRTIEDVKKFVKNNPNHPATVGLEEMLFDVEYGEDDNLYSMTDFEAELEYAKFKYDSELAEFEDSLNG